jgi:hypothetical protein
VQTTLSGLVWRVSSVDPSGRVLRVACVNSTEMEVVEGSVAKLYATRLVEWDGLLRGVRRLSGGMVGREKHVRDMREVRMLRAL